MTAPACRPRAHPGNAAPPCQDPTPLQQDRPPARQPDPAPASQPGPSRKAPPMSPHAPRPAVPNPAAMPSQSPEDAPPSIRLQDRGNGQGRRTKTVRPPAETRSAPLNGSGCGEVFSNATITSVMSMAKAEQTKSITSLPLPLAAPEPMPPTRQPSTPCRAIRQKLRRSWPSFAAVPTPPSVPAPPDDPGRPEGGRDPTDRREVSRRR